MAKASDIEHGRIQDHMPVVGGDGHPIGTVDRVEGEYIKLTETDPQSGGRHHWLPLSTVAGLDGGLVRLSLPAAQARDSWLTEEEVEQRIALDPTVAAAFGRPTPPSSAKRKHGGPKGERNHGQSGQAPGPPGQTSFGVNLKV